MAVRGDWRGGHTEGSAEHTITGRRTRTRGVSHPRQSTAPDAGQRGRAASILAPMRKLAHSFWRISRARVAGRCGSACRWRPQKLGWSPARPARSKSKGAPKQRMEEATKFTDLDRLCLSPQCGFASTEERAKACDVRPGRKVPRTSQDALSFLQRRRWSPRTHQQGDVPSSSAH